MLQACVGRATEIAAFDHLLHAAGGGRGSLALITGELGMGRTALAVEFSDRAVALGFGASLSVCATHTAVRPYWPWSQLVEDRMGAVTAEERSRLVFAIGPALAKLAPGLAVHLDVPSPSGDAGDEFALFQSVVRFWTAAATGQRPLLLVIDDLQWADPASIRLLAHLVTMLRYVPVVLLATLRSGEPIEDARSDAMTVLHRHASLTLPLRGLPSDALVDILRHRGVNNPHYVALDLLARRTGGNPLFVTEILDALDLSDGRIPSMLALADVLPSRITELVRRRLAFLSPAVRRLLDAAAVVGPTGEVRVLAAAADLASSDIQDLMDVAVAGGLIAQDTASGWRFAHAVVRDVIYRALSMPDRRRLHRLVLAALEASAAPVVERAWHVQHVVEDDELPRAIDLLVEAGKEHMAARAYSFAVINFDRAVDLGERLEAGTPAQARRLLLLGEAAHHLDQPTEAEAAFRAAAPCAGDDTELFGAAVLGYLNPAVVRTLAQHQGAGGAMSELREALARFGDAETSVRAQLMARLSFEVYQVGELKRARSIAADAVAMAERVGDPVAIIEAALARYRIGVLGGRSLGSALARSTAMIEVALATGDLGSLHVAHRARFVDCLLSGDLTAADAELNALARVTVERGTIPFDWWWVALWRSMRALLGGHHAEAEAQSARAWATIRLTPMPEAEFNSLVQSVFLRREQGRLAELDTVLRAFAGRSPYRTDVDVLMALRAAELDDLDEAADALLRLMGQIEELREDRAWGGIWFQLARIAFVLNDRAAAVALYELGQERSGQCVVVGLAAVCVGSADLALAWLAETIGGQDEALRWYASAETNNIRVDARAWLAQTRFDHARLLARRGEPDDLMAARHLTDLAAQAAERIGLRPLLQAADDLLAGLVRETREPRERAPEPIAPNMVEPVAAAVDTAVGVFRRSGAQWELTYGGQTVHPPHMKGLSDVARLLSQPGQPLHVSELIALQSSGVVPPSGADEIFDARARQEIRKRLGDLAAEAEDAEDRADLVRAERARAERAELLGSLSSALGLGGRARRLDDPLERARKTITARIRSSIKRIATSHPALARHLERSVDTGLWCVYQPEQPVEWHT
jgi:tetratricopeptide (TPR) repeat protein